MAHWRKLLGSDLARILWADGWRPRKQWTAALIVLWKGDRRPVPINLNQEISKKRVTALCRKADINAERLEQLYVGALPLPPRDLPIPPPPEEPAIGLKIQ